MARKPCVFADGVGMKFRAVMTAVFFLLGAPVSGRANMDLAPAQEPEWTYQKSASYEAYVLVRADGSNVSGAEFEVQLMCKSVFETAEYSRWAMANLVLIGSEPGMVVFQGKISEELVDVTLIIDRDRHVPTFLYVGGRQRAYCKHSFAYP
mgnify:CR=1 FL=1